MKVRIYFPYAPFPSTEGAHLVVADQLRYFVSRGEDVEFVCWRETPESVEKKKAVSGAVQSAKWRLLNGGRESRYARIRRIIGSVPTEFSSPELFHYPLALLHELSELGRADLAIYHFSFAYPWLVHKALLPNESRRIVHFHNVESDLHAVRTGGFGLMQAINARKLREHESKLESLIDESWFLSPRDCEKLGMSGARLVPPTFDPDLRQRRRPSTASQVVVGFIGAMDNRPNFESAKWVLTELAPLLAKAGFGGKLLFAGRSVPLKLRKLGKQYPFVEFAGFVADVDRFWAGLSYLVAPHIVGSGVRTKILEGVASGVPVMTNSKGVLPLTDAVRGSPFLFCSDEPMEWVQRLLKETTPYKMRESLEWAPTCRDLVAESVYSKIV